jgi:hypothetical protein
MRANQKVILAKIETTYSTDAVPVVGTNAILVSDFKITPDIKFTPRGNLALPYFGNRGLIKYGEMFVIEFDVELAGAGGVATVPGYGVLKRLSEMSETVTPTTGPVTYAPITTGEESGTIYFNWDGVLHKALGCRGTQEYRFSEGGVPLIHYRIVGLYGGVTEAAGGTPVLTAFQKPLAVNKANTTFTLHTFAAALKSLTITQGNVHEYVNRPNVEKIVFADRSTTGQCVIELPLPSAKDFIATARAETTGALALVHGTQAGNKVLIDAVTVQIGELGYEEERNTAMLSMALHFLPTSAGNNECTYKTQ